MTLPVSTGFSQQCIITHNNINSYASYVPASLSPLTCSSAWLHTPACLYLIICLWTPVAFLSFCLSVCLSAFVLFHLVFLHLLFSQKWKQTCVTRSRNSNWMLKEHSCLHSASLISRVLRWLLSNSSSRLASFLHLSYEKLYFFKSILIDSDYSHSYFLKITILMIVGFYLWQNGCTTCVDVRSPTWDQVLLLAGDIQGNTTDSRHWSSEYGLDVLVRPLEHLKKKPTKCQSMSVKLFYKNILRHLEDFLTFICLTSYWILLMGFP